MKFSGIQKYDFQFVQMYIYAFHVLIFSSWKLSVYLVQFVLGILSVSVAILIGFYLPVYLLIMILGDKMASDFYIFCSFLIYHFFFAIYSSWAYSLVHSKHSLAYANNESIMSLFGFL